HRILLKEQVRLNIKPDDIVILSALLSLYEKKRNTVSISALAKMTSLTSSKAGEVFNHLIEQGYVSTELELKSDGKEKEVFSLDLLFDKITNMFKADIEQSKNQKHDQDISYIITHIEKTLNKSLSPYDLEIIKEWFTEHFTRVQIEKAIEVALDHHRKTVSYIDRVLRSSETFEKELDEKKRETIDKLIRGVK
ncbi:MAG: hypothetical protein CVV63_03055, partial [Tenericutes bacterium HGW-Tenericutes-8]